MTILSEIKDIVQHINEFREARDWRQYHNPKDLALSLSLEASELLENFQWVSAEEGVEQNNENIKDELADVFIYGLMMADDLDIDIKEAIYNKVKKNGEKYPER